MPPNGQTSPDIRLMRLSKASQYAFQGTVYLARQPKGTYILTEEVAKKLRLPGSFLAKLFQKLAHRGILNSRRGVGGGYSLHTTPEKVALFDILEAIEEPISKENHCLLGSHMCAQGSFCALHETVVEAELLLRATLKRLSLKDLSREPETPHRL